MTDAPTSMLAVYTDQSIDYTASECASNNQKSVKRLNPVILDRSDSILYIDSERRKIYYIHRLYRR